MQYFICSVLHLVLILQFDSVVCDISKYSFFVSLEFFFLLKNSLLSPIRQSVKLLDFA